MAEAMGFYTDTTVCIGCKACEVACKEWNQLPSTNGGLNTLSGDSYDNTRRLDGIHWRHVKFIEQFTEDRKDGRWLLMSDVCKHCVHAACLEVCPTNAIIRTEFDTVVIQSDACNGCRDCISACPFGVIDINPASGTAQKCTLCYDRLQSGMEPACSKACPTDSIQFGTIRELRDRAGKRVQQLHEGGEKRAYLYGADEKMLGGLNSFFLLVDKPEVYGLPPDPKMPSRNLVPGSLFSMLGAILVGLIGIFNFRNRGALRRPRGDAAMNGIPSSTYFTVPPDWGWLIVFYFFFGGLAGGCYFFAVLIDLFGRPEDRPLARLGYYIAFPCVVISGILLTVDLTRPERFWHMLIESNTLRPMFKHLVADVAWFLGAVDIRRIYVSVFFRRARRWRPCVVVCRAALAPAGNLGPRRLRSSAGFSAFTSQGYTGVLLAVTNRPIWSDTPLLGMLFVVSAASISAALMILLAHRSGWTTPGLLALHRIDVWVIALEFLVLIAVMISLGPVARAWLNAWGLLLFFGVIVIGMLIPLALYWRRDWLGERNMTAAAALVLVGGFLLALVIVFSAEGV